MEIRIQRQLSNGNYIDSDDAEYFLTECEKFKKMTRDEIITRLAAGEELKYDCDWYTKIRCGNAYDARIAARAAARPAPVMVRCACGHTVEKSLVMSGSMGSCCPDCYDRMS